MSDHPRERISTRIAADTRAVIERLAAERRTTPAQVARVLLEDGARQAIESGESQCRS